jgi:hypothetical protein
MAAVSRGISGTGTSRIPPNQAVAPDFGPRSHFTTAIAVADGIAVFRQYVHDEDAESAGIAAALVEFRDARGTSPN